MTDWVDVPVGTHACCRFDTAEQRQRVVTEFVTSGLARQERVAQFAAQAQEAVAAGYTALRVYADNGAMPAALASPDLWLDYELRAAATIGQFPLIGLCGFSADDPPALPPELIDAVHDRNPTPHRPSSFHFRGRNDGSFALTGELEQHDLAYFRRVITAAAPVLSGNLLSLHELDFVDNAGARELYRLTRGSAPIIWGIPPIVRRMWQALGLTSPG